MIETKQETLFTQDEVTNDTGHNSEKKALSEHQLDMSEQLQVAESEGDPKERHKYPYVDDDIEDVDIDQYEIVRPEFFSHNYEPAFTVNVDKVTVNAACVRQLPDIDCVQIMVYREEKKLILFPCGEDETAYRWAREKNGRRYSRPKTGEEFVMMLCSMMDWNPDFRYKILGRKVRAKGKIAFMFDLSVYECHEKVVAQNGKRRSMLHSAFVDNSGRFGPTYAESKRMLDVKRFDKYTVITISNKTHTVTEQPAEGAENGQTKDGQ